MKVVLHWFRRDLRVSDNAALHHATLAGERVIPVFVLEDALHSGPDVGAGRLAFLLRSVDSLRKNLAALGYPLIIRQGRSETVLPQLAKETGASIIFANKRYEPYAQKRDQRVADALRTTGIELRLFKDAVAWEEQEILTQGNKPYTVFTPYSKAWKVRPMPAPWPKLARTTQTFPEIASESLPLDSAEFGHPLKQDIAPAGEHAALDILKHFMSGPVLEYAEQRNIPTAKGTSNLSPHLRAGTIGIRTILAKLQRARQGTNPAEARNCEVYQNELIWREFYQQILHNFPHVTQRAFKPQYDHLAWSANREHFTAWCTGQTGYPIVDAAMRCLNATGAMHNRLRMIVAMFLTKDLLINWQWGERYFMQQLLDGDLGANNGGWQWSAGTGTDAAPYFRIFNPVSQGESCDAKGDFVRQWVPELAHLPADIIHQPWSHPLRARDLKYPQRIVRHEIQRPKCLAMYQAVRNLPESA